MIFSCIWRHNDIRVVMCRCLVRKGEGVDIGECGLTVNGPIVWQLNHLSEYGGCLAPRDNQDFDPYVSPLRSLIHQCDCVRGGKTILQSIGVYSTFCFSLQVIFLFNFFLFLNNFLAPKKMQLRPWVNSRYHGGGPTQVNQAWHVICFFAPKPHLTSVTLTTCQPQIYTAQGDFNCSKTCNCLRKRREEGEGYLFVQKFYNCKSCS